LKKKIFQVLTEIILANGIFVPLKSVHSHFAEVAPRQSTPFDEKIGVSSTVYFKKKYGISRQIQTR
jgi:hypothetical protein